MSAAAGAFFSGNSEDETLNKRVRPTNDQFEFLRENRDRLKEWIEEDVGEVAGCTISTFLQGSYRFHTLIRPMGRNKEYDVDMGVYFEWDGRNQLHTHESVRRLVQRSIVAYANVDESVKAIEDPPKERCSRVIYDKSFHIDLPVYHLDTRTDEVKLATLNNGWERSDPSEMLEWFRASLDGEQRAQVRRLIRYFKALIALNFSPDDEVPSSLMLTVLVVEAIATLGDEQDDDAFGKVLDQILRRLTVDRTVRNPVLGDSDDDINRLSEDGHRHFLDHLVRFVDIAERAAACDNIADASIVWSEAFDFHFPLPDADVLAIETAQGTGVAVASPTFRIGVSAMENGPIDRWYEGEVPFARIGEWMHFSISNPDVIPDGATIRWVVRNEGEHAHRVNDLGHSMSDTGQLAHKERAAYFGRHYLDCEVRLFGRIHTVNRISVNITGQAMPVRNPPRRPPYTRLIQGRGRRR